MSSKLDTKIPQETDGEIQQVNLRVPYRIYKAVKQEALDQDKTAQDVWIDAACAYLRIDRAA